MFFRKPKEEKRENWEVNLQRDQEVMRKRLERKREVNKRFVGKQLSFSSSSGFEACRQK